MLLWRAGKWCLDEQPAPSSKLGSSSPESPVVAALKDRARSIAAAGSLGKLQALLSAKGTPGAASAEPMMISSPARPPPVVTTAHAAPAVSRPETADQQDDDGDAYSPIPAIGRDQNREVGATATRGRSTKE